MQNFLNLTAQPSEEAMIKNGYLPLSGKALKQKIVGKVVWGDYLRGFKFISIINQDGTMEGKNNYDVYDFGS